MQLIDSHCHLNYDYSPKSLNEVLQEARDVGVETLVTIGADFSTLNEVQGISEKYPNVYHTVGVHPHETHAMTDEDLVVLEKLARHPKCRAIGEIGLDYYYSHSPKEVQVLRLQQQLDLALKLELPVVIHSRDGEADLYTELAKYAERKTASQPLGQQLGVIHCFSGTVEFGQKCLELGFYVSFSGILTFKKAEEVREAARLFPLERLLVETDAPYLAPVPHRGKKCEPAMVRLTAEKLAEVKGIPLETVATVTTENARRLFSLTT